MCQCVKYKNDLSFPLYTLRLLQRHPQKKFPTFSYNCLFSFTLSGSRLVYHADKWWPRPLACLCGSVTPPEITKFTESRPRSGGPSALASTCQSAATSPDKTPRHPATTTGHVRRVGGEPSSRARSESPTKKKHFHLLWNIDCGILPHPHPRPQSQKWQHFGWLVFTSPHWMNQALCVWLICHWFFLCDAENCPDHNPSLSSWNPGHQPQKAMVVRTGQLLRLESSATFLSLTIQSGGKHIDWIE